MTDLKPGIYRRAFDWRLSTTRKESIPNIAAAFAALSSDEYADIFEDYLKISRNRKDNRTAMAKVQLHLIEELVIAQAAIKHYRKKLDELKTEPAKPPGAGDRAGGPSDGRARRSGHR